MMSGGVRIAATAQIATTAHLRNRRSDRNTDEGAVKTMFGYWEIILLVLVVVLLFGRGKISDLMGDVAKGIKSFKTGLKDDEPALESKTDNAIQDASKKSDTSTSDASKS